jgi:drug/metabolite transporter (DMT)-like permease
MRANDNVTDAAREARGLGWGLLGVLGFSLSMPATRAAVPALGGLAVGLGRAAGAAALAAGLLLLKRERLPERRHWAGLASVAFGAVLGFPVLSALALETVPATHASVVVGLSPAATAAFGAWRARERPGLLFWAAAGLGALSALGLAWSDGAGHLGAGDALLALAVLLVAWGYAEGGRLAQELDGWRVICWALLLALPVTGPGLLWLARGGLHGDTRAWLGLGYLTVISTFLAFFAWYRGLARGGIAAVSQLQLVQPLLSVAWSALLLGEALSGRLALCALGVVGSVALSRWARSRR